MKILVLLKRTPHRDSKIKIGADGKLAAAALKYEVNPFDELAVEEALRIKEARGAEVVEVIVASVGDESCQQQLVQALAMGADRAIRVDAGGAPLDSLGIARCLEAVARRESPDLVLAGKLAYDEENGQVPAMLAELLGWPQASQASGIELDAGGRSAKVVCEVDAGLEEVELGLPAVITADLRLNEPRYASLPGIMKAKKKPQATLAAADLVEPSAARARVTAHRGLAPRRAGVRVASVEELARALGERKLI